MSRSNDPDYFFQTSHSIAETNRKKLKSKNSQGSPTQLNSKILAVLADPIDSNAVYLAESVGTARRLLLGDSSKTTHVYRGPTTPVTCLAISYGSEDRNLFAGSWDKSIWSWSSRTCNPGRRFLGHADFVNALLWIRTADKDLLISGSSDATITIWDANKAERLHVLRGHTQAVLDLAIDPSTYASPQDSANSILVFSAGTDRTIRQWRIKQDTTLAEEIDHEKPIIQHETSIYCIRFDADDDLWTASADGTAKCLSRTRKWQADTTLTHGDYVRSVTVDEKSGWIVTAGRDEHVKVWDRATGKLHHTYEGHFEEVTGLAMMSRTVISVSIDATVRKWSLQLEDLKKAKEVAEDALIGVKNEEVVELKPAHITEEEERELEDLLNDSD